MNAPEDGTVWNWLIGGAASVLAIAMGVVYRKAEATEDALAEHKLEDVRAYALKVDVSALREHVDGRFEALKADQAEGFRTVLAALDRLDRSRP